jgi:hypothetical protein
MRLCIVLALVLVLATSAFALEARQYQLKQDFGTDPLYDCQLRYFYYIPCPTSSSFWGYYGWLPGDIIGQCFNIGDQGTNAYPPCDPSLAHTLEQMVFIEFTGLPATYPGLYTVEFDLYCAGEVCCGPQEPVLHLWNSGPYECVYAWNYLDVDPPLCLTPDIVCCTEPMPTCAPSVVVTATHTGTDGIYPVWGFDNISSAIGNGCVMHDAGCLPIVYPRTPCGWGSGQEVHSGFIGAYPFEYWPPAAFPDANDTTPYPYTLYGCIEWALQIRLLNTGFTAVETSTWGSIKSMYE